MKAGDAAKVCEADLTGVKSLVLKVSDAGDGMEWDHADWAGAKFETAQQAGLPVIFKRTDIERGQLPQPGRYRPGRGQRIDGFLGSGGQKTEHGEQRSVLAYLPEECSAGPVTGPGGICV